MTFGCDKGGCNNFWGDSCGKDSRGASGNRECHHAFNRTLKISTDEMFTVFQYFCILVRGYTNVENMFAMTSATPLLANLESKTTSPKRVAQKTLHPMKNRGNRVLVLYALIFCTYILSHHEINLKIHIPGVPNEKSTLS